jgi:hypothetical protein
MLSAVMLSVIMLSAIMLSAIMLSVVAPLKVIQLLNCFSHAPSGKLWQTDVILIKHFFLFSGQNKLECLSIKIFTGQPDICV